MGELLRDAAARGDSEEVVRLLGEGVKHNLNQSGRNALHLAAAGGHADVVAALLLARWDVNAQDPAGYTALQRAAADGHLEVVKQLLKHGANVNIQDKVHGNTALHEASWKGYSKCVDILCKAPKANLQIKNFGGFAPLHLSCQNGHNQSCRELLLANANPDIQNNYGDTPLHTSARYGHAGVTRILISAECKVSEQNKNGDTALHIAAAMGRRKLTRIMLEAGCDKNRRNKQNETCKDIAIRKDLNEIIRIIDETVPIPRDQQKKEQQQQQEQKKKKGKENDKKREKNGSGTSSKDSSSRQKEKKKHKNDHQVHFSGLNGSKWSPYGCHYYPDFKTFPKPRLDSLPNEPLKKGEQYYLDLAGNIRKGPVGVGYTCYCAPFFRHMEERLDRDKRELKDHIDAAHNRLDKKVSSLEAKTNGQLNEITRAMALERAKCNQRHLHLEQWLIRGSIFRNSERARLSSHEETSVPRTKSLENILEERMPLSGTGHRSVEMLNTAYDINEDNKRSSSREGKESGKGSSEVVVSTDEDSRRINDEDRLRGGGRSIDVVDGGGEVRRRREIERRERKLRRTTREISEKIDEVLRNGDGPERMETLYSEMMKWRSYHKALNEMGHDDNEVVIPERRKSFGGEEPQRRSVQEMVAKLQKQNTVQDIVSKIQKKTDQLHKTAKKWSETKENRKKERLEVQKESESESSEGEDDGRKPSQRHPGLMPVPNYENISHQDENENPLSQLPYRCRNGVYSPSTDLETEFNKLAYDQRQEDSRVMHPPDVRRPMYDSTDAIDRRVYNAAHRVDKKMFASDHDLMRTTYSPSPCGNTFYERALRIHPAERIYTNRDLEPAYSPTHNDSGYSTKPYGGSSTGPSPSLSGQDVELGSAAHLKPPVPLRGRVTTTASLV